jgi:hypothetical protein
MGDKYEKRKDNGKRKKKEVKVEKRELCTSTFPANHLPPLDTLLSQHLRRATGPSSQHIIRPSVLSWSFISDPSLTWLDSVKNSPTFKNQVS